MDLFKGELVRLTHLQRDDIPAALRWMRDYEVRALADDEVAVPMTDEAQEAWYEETIKSNDVYPFSIRTLASDQLIGSLSLFAINHKDRFAEYGIVIGEKDYWGKGYGTDATRIALRFAFDELNLNRVFLEVFAHNQRAVRSYEKAGFVLEGTLRQALFRAGQYHDVHVMAVVRDDWWALQGG